MGLLYKLSLAVADYQLNIGKPKANDYLWNDDPRLDLLFADLKISGHNFNAEEEAILAEKYAVAQAKCST